MHGNVNHSRLLEMSFSCYYIGNVCINTESQLILTHCIPLLYSLNGNDRPIVFSQIEQISKLGVGLVCRRLFMLSRYNYQETLQRNFIYISIELY